MQYEFNIIDFMIHPDYFKYAHKSGVAFKCGVDIALAVIEIPMGSSTCELGTLFGALLAFRSRAPSMDSPGGSDCFTL